MFLSKKKNDKKSTLVFRTKKGIRRLKWQNVLNEQIDSDSIKNEIKEHSEDERFHSEGENVNG